VYERQNVLENCAPLPRDAAQSALLPWRVVPSFVCPSVCDTEVYTVCGHIARLSSKVITRIVSSFRLVSSLSVAANVIVLVQGEYRQISGEL